MINFSAATEKHVGAEAGPVQNPAGLHNENIANFKRPNFDSGHQENRLEALRTFKRNVVQSISNARKMYSNTRLVRS